MRRLISVLNRDGIDYRDFLRLKIADRKANSAKPDYAPSDIEAMAARFHIMNTPGR